MSAPPERSTEAPTEKLRVFGTVADPVARNRPDYPAPVMPTQTSSTIAAAALDRLWLRCTVVLASAMGAALVAVGTATYLMAVEKDEPAWTAYGVAAVITLVMAVIPWLYLRQLRRGMDASASAA